jgi:hypothetical protein
LELRWKVKIRGLETHISEDFLIQEIQGDVFQNLRFLLLKNGSVYFFEIDRIRSIGKLKKDEQVLFEEVYIDGNEY